MSRKRQRQPGAAADGALLKRLKAEVTKKHHAHQSVILCFGYEPWQKADAAWFSAHPRRSLRLRKLQPGELPKIEGDATTHALIRQHTPGLRERMFIVGTDAEKHLAANDYGLMLLWQRLSDTALGRAVRLGDVIADCFRTPGGIQ